MAAGTGRGMGLVWSQGKVWFGWPRGARSGFRGAGGARASRQMPQNLRRYFLEYFPYRNSIPDKQAVYQKANIYLQKNMGKAHMDS